ncbi:MAG TPA: hypothetical protein VL977_05180, partial [Solirubrobacteraceae bacterium]|nr:hypothetical protein [Solirubrobacteraceae bacterium]
MAPGPDTQEAVAAAPPVPLLRRLTAGGIEGNGLLTTATGALLLILLAALGVTVLAIGPLIDAHLFLGMLLLGPVALKLASVGYRFTRYYAGNARYRQAGPPQILLRLLAPAVVLSTLAIFV